jgi:tetratricopeptide (TPR) repeat protein/cold shock CspA family protein
VSTKSVPMTRARLYVLIDAFERDMRSLLARFVATEFSEQDMLGRLYEKAAGRRNEDEGANEETPLTEYVDLREAYDLLNTHRKHLPDELAREVRELTASMDRLVAVRRRVMHPRPLLADDSDAAPMILNQFCTRYWSETRRMFAQLDEDPSWEPLVTLHESDTLTLHNLPLPEYDETGLIGRSKEVDDVLQIIKRGRESVITITGEGGIGKTALALEVAYRLVDDPSQPFDAIMWTSLKHERLTAQGIQEIANATRDLTGAISPLGQTLDSAFQGNLRDLADCLSGLKVLIVFDNLETIGGVDFAHLYETLPDSIAYLVTSRIGVGEYERRYALPPLSAKDGLRLFNDFVRARRLESLQRLTTVTRSEVIERLRYSPLVIRWFVLAVEAGMDPLTLIRDQTEVLEFCVRSVYDALGNGAREVLATLSVLARPVTADELVVLLEQSTDAVNIGLQELIRGSLVRRDSSGAPGDLSLRVRLTETATQFLKKRVVVDRDLAVLISTRDAQYRANEERRLADTAVRSLAPIVVRTDGPQDAPTAQILRRALLASQNGDYETAYADLETAHRLNPDLWEVDRVEGFILAAAGEFAPALKSYEIAYEKATGEGRGVVAHYLAGHWARNLRNLPRAITYAREAHQTLDSPETAVALGNYFVWNGQFEEGIRLIEPAVVSSDGKSKLIAVSSLATSYRRWAEAAREHEHNPVLQYRRGLHGLSIALASLEAGVADRRLRDVAADCATTALQGAAAAASDSIMLANLGASVDRLSMSLVRLVETPSWPRLHAAALRLSRVQGVSAAAQRLPRLMSEMDPLAVGDRVFGGGQRLYGEVVNLNSTYGFIRHPAFPRNVFFHRDDVAEGKDLGDFNTGALVSFLVSESNRGHRAFDVQRQT